MKNFLKFVLIFVAIIKVLDSFVLYGHGDPFNVYLVIGKYLRYEDWSDIYTQIPAALYSGYFDFLYAIPVALFYPSIIAQLLCQFLHFLFSLGLGSYFLYKKLIRDYGFVTACLAALSILTINKSYTSFLYAKSDGVIALLTLLASWFVISYKGEKDKKYFLSLGILIGLIPAIKMSGLFSCVPLGLIVIYKEYKSPKNIITLILGGILVFGPIMARNYYYIGNPLFPGLISLFPGKYSVSMLNHMTQYFESGFSFSALISILKTFLMGKILFLIAPVIFVLNIRKKESENNLYFLAATTIVILYAMMNGGYQPPRFFFAVYFLLIIFIFKSIGIYIENFDKKYIFILLALILVDSKIDKSLKRISKIYPKYSTMSQKDLINEVAPYTRIWNYVRTPKKGEKVYVISDSYAQHYYSPIGIRLHHQGSYAPADFLRECKGEDYKKLRKYEYAIISKESSNLCYKQIIKSDNFLFEISGFKLYRL